MTKKEYNWTWASLALIFFISFLIISGFSDDTDPKGEIESFESDYYNKESGLDINNATQIEDNYSQTDKPHWGHMPLTYRIDDNCSSRLVNLSRTAFMAIRDETDQLVNFEEVSENPDISIHCKPSVTDTSTGEGSVADAVHDVSPDNEKLIISGDINIYGQGMACNTGYPALEVHEILHTLAFDHNSLMSSVMAPYSAYTSKKCKIKNIDIAYINCMKYIYSNGVFGGCEGVSKNVYGDSNGFLDPFDSEVSCDDRWYKAEGGELCCPEPNMYIDEEGYCASLDYKCEEGTYEATNDPDSCCPDLDMWTDEDYCYYAWEDGS